MLISVRIHECVFACLIIQVSSLLFVCVCVCVFCDSSIQPFVYIYTCVCVNVCLFFDALRVSSTVHAHAGTNL
jgi:hypothetical protein